MEICSLNGQCGGCLYQGVAYEEQVLLKGEEVKKYIEEKKMKTGRYVGIEGSPAIYRYRNKMEYTFGNLEKGGEMTLGMHKRGQYMTILNVDRQSGAGFLPPAGVPALSQKEARRPDAESDYPQK